MTKVYILFVYIDLVKKLNNLEFSVPILFRSPCLKKRFIFFNKDIFHRKSINLFLRKGKINNNSFIVNAYCLGWKKNKDDPIQLSNNR